MVRNGRRLTRITNDEFEKFRLNVARGANLDVAPLNGSNHIKQIK